MKTVKVKGIQAMAARRAGIGVKVQNAGKITQEVPASRLDEVKRLASKMAQENGRRGAETARARAEERKWKKEQQQQKEAEERDPLGMEGAEDVVGAAIAWRQDVQRAGAILALSVKLGYLTHDEALSMISGLP